MDGWMEGWMDGWDSPWRCSSELVVGGESLQFVQRLPLVSAFINDITVLTTTVPYTKRPLGSSIVTLLGLGWILNLASVKVTLLSMEQKLHIDGIQVLAVLEMPLKSLGQWCDSKLTNTKQTRQLKKDIMKCVARPYCKENIKCVWCASETHVVSSDLLVTFFLLHRTYPYG